jgi:hypothetical protein
VQYNRHTTGNQKPYALSIELGEDSFDFPDHNEKFSPRSTLL